jgi:hypothetical protein
MFPRCLRSGETIFKKSDFFSKIGFLSGETMFKKSDFFKDFEFPFSNLTREINDV